MYVLPCLDYHISINIGAFKQCTHNKGLTVTLMETYTLKSAYCLLCYSRGHHDALMQPWWVYLLGLHLCIMVTAWKCFNSLWLAWCMNAALVRYPWAWIPASFWQRAYYIKALYSTERSQCALTETTCSIATTHNTCMLEGGSSDTPWYGGCDLGCSYTCCGHHWSSYRGVFGNLATWEIFRPETFDFLTFFGKHLV